MAQLNWIKRKGFNELIYEVLDMVRTQKSIYDINHEVQPILRLLISRKAQNNDLIFWPSDENEDQDSLLNIKTFGEYGEKECPLLTTVQFR